MMLKTIRKTSLQFGFVVHVRFGQTFPAVFSGGSFKAAILKRPLLV